MEALWRVEEPGSRAGITELLERGWIYLDFWLASLCMRLFEIVYSLAMLDEDTNAMYINLRVTNRNKLKLR